MKIIRNIFLACFYKNHIFKGVYEIKFYIFIKFFKNLTL